MIFQRFLNAHLFCIIPKTYTIFWNGIKYSYVKIEEENSQQSHHSITGSASDGSFLKIRRGHPNGGLGFRCARSPTHLHEKSRFLLEGNVKLYGGMVVFKRQVEKCIGAYFSRDVWILHLTHYARLAYLIPDRNVQVPFRLAEWADTKINNLSVR